MHPPRGLRLPSVSLGMMLVFPLVFAAVRSQKSASPAAVFVDVTQASGIDFHLTCGGAKKLYIMESMCGGVAVIDYDNDGWPDIFLVNGSTLEEFRAGKSPASKLYHNNHDGTFTDVTEKAGLAHRGWCFGAAVGDYDNDGWDDLYITCLTGSYLYKNKGDGTFKDVTAQAGVGNPGRWGTSAAFGDYDRDGYLDLYVTNYVDLDLNHLYHNNGDGTFDDRAGAAGFGAVSVPFLGFGVRFLDYDNDGWKDIFVANGHVNPQVDEHPFGVTYAQRALLFHNLRSGRFEEVGLRASHALGQRRVSRGLDVADITNDEVRANNSYLSASDARLHFGLGSATRVDQVVIRWPSGVVEKLASLPVDWETVIREGAGEAMPIQP